MAYSGNALTPTTHSHWTITKGLLASNTSLVPVDTATHWHSYRELNCAVHLLLLISHAVNGWILLLQKLMNMKPCI